MERVELRDEKLCLSAVRAHSALLAGSEDVTRKDMSMTRIRATLADCVVTAKKLFHVLVMNVRGPALTVIRRITDMNGALAWL